MKTTVAAVALAAVAGLGLWTMNRPSADLPLLPVTAANAETAAPATAPAETPAKIEIKDMTLGQENAPVTLIEYASFTCPHCANFHATVFENLKRDYIDTGKVKFVYREVYFDRYGLWAAMMARCGGEMRYFGISDILYNTQRDWAGSEDANVVVGNIKRIGKSVGMDDATLDACLKDGAMAQALVDHYDANMKEFDVKGTPTLVINGTVHSNMTYDDLKQILDAELAK